MRWPCVIETPYRPSRTYGRPMRDVLTVAAGGAIGASLRYVIALALVSRGPGYIPWNTALVNISGAFLLGLVVTLSLDRNMLSEAWLLFIGIGILGGYTTFSTFSFETFDLLREGAIAQAALYSIGSLILGVLAAFAGFALGRAL